jgi:hypothetical protein
MISLLLAMVLTASPMPSVDETIDALARSIPYDQAMQAYIAMYAENKHHRGVFVPKPAQEMPANDPLVHYAGMRSDGSFEIWMTVASKTFSEGQNRAFGNAMIAAMIRAAAEDGDAGPDWKARFDHATDPLLLSRAVARAITMKAETQQEQARQNLAWTREHIKSGMRRQEVYSALRGRGITAYNNAYNPGEALGNGCRYDTTKAKGDFPLPGQPLAQGPCANRLGPETTDTGHPTVYVDYVVDSNVACGIWVYQHYIFDEQDRLRELKEFPRHPVCL